MKTTLRISEETFKSDLRSKEVQLEVLRNGVLNGIASRQQVLYERRVKAIEQLWSSVLSLAPEKEASIKLSAFNYEEILKLSEENPKVQEMFNQIDENNNLDYFKTNEAAMAIFCNPGRNIHA